MNEDIKSIYFKGYKCFNKEDFQEIKDIKNVNVIVGKNNTGKSSVIDIINFAVDENDYIKNRSRFDEIKLGLIFNQRHYEHFMEDNVLHYREHEIKRYLDKEIIVDVNEGNYRYQLAKNLDKDLSQQLLLGEEQKFMQIINTCYNIPNRNKYFFRRLNAERDIVPEPEIINATLSANGNGASNLVRVLKNFSDYDEKLIEQELLYALNRIVNPEAVFSRIVIQQSNNNNGSIWEIYFYEEKAETVKVALSEIGSGFRPLILMLLYLLVLPNIEDKQNRKFVYAFEDIENNLHPALQKRLFEYIYKFAVDNEICIFFTTHSHIAINTFFKKEQAAIYHIKKEENGSVGERVNSLSDANNLLVDLGVLPSDMFLSNGIIWVEGESDRIYIKKWLEIFYGDELKENVDYIIMFYGGNSLAHLTISEKVDDKINLLKINNNALLVMDSDKKSEYDEDMLVDRSKSYKGRLKKEFEEKGKTVWETLGREIENYLPKEVVESVIGHKISGELEAFDSMKEYYENNAGDGTTFKKVRFSKQAFEFINKDNSKDILDLKEQIDKLYNEIKKWNGQA